MARAFSFIKRSKQEAFDSHVDSKKTLNFFAPTD